FLFYNFYYIPKATKLDIPTSIPTFSVYYLYYLKPISVNAFQFGSQEIPAQKLGETIENDLKNIKDIGFDGIRISYHFKENNYISDRITLKAAKQKLYPSAILLGHNTKPKTRAFNDQELNEWQDFVREAVKKNKNTIYFWEVWNEPAIDDFRYGSAKEYLKLLKVSYKIIKEENPNAKVVVTLDPVNGEKNNFSEELLSLGASNYFDILSFHPYAANPYIREDVFNSTTAKAEEISKKINKPLWISEIGQPTSEVSEKTQAELAEFVLENSYSKKIPLVWFHYSDQRAYMVGPDNSYGWGLLDKDGNPKQIFNTIKNFIKLAKTN
ncbi:MAG: hypothetical protein V1824_00675, partial [archaeon]